MKKVLIAVNARRGTSVMAGSNVKVSQSERQSNKYKHAKCCPKVMCVDEDSCKCQEGYVTDYWIQCKVNAGIEKTHLQK